MTLEGLAELQLREQRRLMQDGFSLGLNQRALNSGFDIKYYNRGRYTGYAFLFMRNDDRLVELVSFYPRDKYPEDMRNGYGSLCHFATIKLISVYLGKDWRMRDLTPPEEISSNELKLLYSMGIDPFFPNSVEEYYELSMLNAKGRNFFIDQMVLSHSQKDELMFRFPSSLNKLNCPQCFEHCPLINAQTEDDLWAVLRNRAPVLLDSDRKVGGDPSHRLALLADQAGQIHAQCYEELGGGSRRVRGRYPLPPA